MFNISSLLHWTKMVKTPKRSRYIHSNHSQLVSAQLKRVGQAAKFEFSYGQLLRKRGERLYIVYKASAEQMSNYKWYFSQMTVCHRTNSAFQWHDRMAARNLRENSADKRNNYFNLKGGPRQCWWGCKSGLALGQAAPTETSYANCKD